MAPLIRFPLKQYTSFVSASVTAAGADGRHSVGGGVKIPSIDCQGRSFMISAVGHKIFCKGPLPREKTTNEEGPPLFTRRHLIKAAGAGLALTGSGFGLRSVETAAAPIDLPAALPEGVRSNAMLDALPGKKPLIKLSYRPPNYETPIEYFRTAITPNDAFFVRYHLPNIPEVDARTWKIVVGGEGANRQAEFSFDDLNRLPAAEVVAVNQCSGNRRGLFQPHVPGGQWGYGAMGCARWKGARLKDLLDKAGLKKEAIEIAFDGADSPIIDKTPDFIKSIPTWKAVEDTTLVAYEMNGAALPHFNGFPARLVVPGWTGTYWM